jgi:hypothetical protein
MIILVVTPTRNADEFLDETIFSIITQAGNFDLYYHIQDSQSSDLTISIIKKWEQILSNPENNFSRSKVSFSWISESDKGLYDAVNRGFAYLLKKIGDYEPDTVVMGWLNGDDILTHGSLQTVSEFFSANDYKWVTGVPSLIRCDSIIMDLRPSPCCFSRHFLMKGCYDGRHFQFLQQEGTFWRQTLWETAGPLNSELKLAGDWDLWRRFAQDAELITLNAVLGHHRRRHGQLSSDLEPYHQEVDTVLSKEYPISEVHESLENKYFAPTARWDFTISQWQIDFHEVLESKESLKARAELQQTQIKLQQARDVIVAMESSKFWKMRKIWMRFKEFFR